MEKNSGRELEFAVKRLLALKGVSNLSSERQFESKKADLYFEVRNFGAKKRFAVECKDLTGVLLQKQVAAIYSGYAAVFKSGAITDLLIVSRERLAPSAQSYVDSVPQISHMTFDELRNSIIDFIGYLTGLKQRFSDDPAFNYYIRPEGSIRVANSDQVIFAPDLINSIREELGRTTLPLAVLGAYGIGKTTLAKYLFLEFYEEWERDKSKPIPIYISLHRMMREQTLEGLLGGIFTSISPCDGYNFDIFCSLNSIGSFVIILDGLDEMRHKLTWEEFQYNISQLSILTSKNPRSILLGRPSAFMDQGEYNSIIHGRSGNSAKAFAFESKGKFREVFIDGLSSPQIDDFVDRFCSWKYPNQTRLSDRVKKLLSDSNNEKIKDIVRRPVQLMMFLEIFPELPPKLDHITQATIYSLFVDQLIEREKGKDTRRMFSKEEHRRFGQRVAWWLWLRGGDSRVEASQIGLDVLEDFLRPNEQLDVVRRALVTSSFLTTQGGTFLHFPHRSMQEFFVAEHIAALARTRGALAIEFQRHGLRVQDVFTPEVIDFLAPHLDGEEAVELVTLFEQIKVIPRNALELTTGGHKFKETVVDHLRRTGSVVCAWFCLHELIREKSLGNDEEVAANDLMNDLASLLNGRGAAYGRILAAPVNKNKSLAVVEATRLEEQLWQEVASYLLCMLVIVSKNPSCSDSFVAALERLESFRAVRTTVREGTQRGKDSRKRVFESAPFVSDLYDRLSENLFGDRLNIDWIYKHLRAKLRSVPFVPEWIVGDSIHIPGLKLRTDFRLAKGHLKDALETIKRTNRGR